MLERIDRVLLPVRDAAQAAAWYEREFAFRPESLGEREACLRVGEGETALCLTERRPFRPLPHLHREGHVPCFNFYTHNEHLHAQRLRERGIEVLDPMDVPYMKVSEFTDSDGNVIGMCHERVQSLYFTPNLELLPPMFHRVLAVFLPVVDLEASIRWYVDALGFELYNHWGQGADLRVGQGQTIVTMIAMNRDIHRRALDALAGTPYFSLQTAHIERMYAHLRESAEPGHSVRMSAAGNELFLSDPEGLPLLIADKERTPIVKETLSTI